MSPAFATVAYWNIAGGILSGLLAAVFGAIDWLAIPSGTRARVIGLYHGLGNVIVVALFAVSWWIRSGTNGLFPTPLAFSIAVAALMLGGATGWLGGERVDRLGVGVDDGPLSTLSARSPAGRRTRDPSTARFEVDHRRWQPSIPGRRPIFSPQEEIGREAGKA